MFLRSNTVEVEIQNGETSNPVAILHDAATGDVIPWPSNATTSAEASPANVAQGTPFGTLVGLVQTDLAGVPVTEATAAATPIANDSNCTEYHTKVAACNARYWESWWSLSGWALTAARLVRAATRPVITVADVALGGGGLVVAIGPVAQCVEALPDSCLAPDCSIGTCKYGGSDLGCRPKGGDPVIACDESCQTCETDPSGNPFCAGLTITDVRLKQYPDFVVPSTCFPGSGPTVQISYCGRPNNFLSAAVEMTSACPSGWSCPYINPQVFGASAANPVEMLSPFYVCGCGGPHTIEMYAVLNDQYNVSNFFNWSWSCN
jgi:hypothetical protein